MKSSSNKEFVFGSFVYRYDLVMQDRLTLSLTVKPDLGITLKAPHGAENERVETFLKKKWFWLEKQLRFFKKYHRRTYEKEYIAGEGFLYLGKQYKLMVQRSSEDKVSMTKGLLMVHTRKGVQDRRHVKKLLDNWYAEKIARVFRERYRLMQEKFDYKKMPPLVVREMKKRWGSFLDNDTVILNPKLIHTSRECIDYVIVHELCHRRYKSHNKLFFKFLTQKFPKWEKVKDKLETIGVQTG